jgi:hypothetical protein
VAGEADGAPKSEGAARQNVAAHGAAHAGAARVPRVGGAAARDLGAHGPEKLDLFECSELTALPAGLGAPTSLQVLDLRASGLTALPEHRGEWCSGSSGSAEAGSARVPEVCCADSGTRGAHGRAGA